jgi:glycosyltransferase XagB
VEYSALFDAILPALARLGLPVPLGGASNHFRRDTLIAVGGWDPFNVTEDADLGFRLARRGWRTTVAASTTWEEAPAGFRVWFRQRTRWMKGWSQPQTYQRFWLCPDAEASTILGRAPVRLPG